MRRMKSPTPGNARLPERYSRQVLFDRLGPEGQRQLLDSRVTLIGCGGLGTMIADTLVRAGVGFVRICDRDFVESNNLQRQTLFDEADVAGNLPKAEAARLKLCGINSLVTVEAVVADVNHTNIERFAEDSDLVLDGTDNFEARYLINDLAVKHAIPWVYGAVVGSTGLCLPVLPGKTPCLRCVFETPPPADMTPTCDTVGVLAPAVAVVAALQCTEAFKILSDRLDEVSRHLTSIDVWEPRMVNLNVMAPGQSQDCPCCRGGRFDYLDGRSVAMTSSLCGRDAVQINRSGTEPVDFALLAAKLRPVSQQPVVYNQYLLRAHLDGHEVTLFADGRTIIKGTDDPDRARSIHARYMGG